MALQEESKIELACYGYVKQMENKYHFTHQIPMHLVEIILLYYPRFWWFKGNNRFTINGSTVKSQNTNCNKTVYGFYEVSVGKHEWKIKVIQCTTYLMIGIASNTKHLDCFYEKHDICTYSYYSDGRKFMNGSQDLYPDGIPVKFGNGDIMTVNLDLDKRTISFCKNGHDLGILCDKIDTNHKYRLAICSYYANDEFQMISYKNRTENK
eukprot:412348_1